MDEVELKVDSKGRICLPPAIREEMGDTVIATRTPKGILITAGRRRGFIEEFNKAITAEPERTGKPENWSPERMKEIWVSEADHRARH